MDIPSFAAAFVLSRDPLPAKSVAPAPIRLASITTTMPRDFTPRKVIKEPIAAPPESGPPESSLAPPKPAPRIVRQEEPMRPLIAPEWLLGPLVFKPAPALRLESKWQAQDESKPTLKPTPQPAIERERWPEPRPNIETRIATRLKPNDARQGNRVLSNFSAPRPSVSPVWRLTDRYGITWTNPNQDDLISFVRSRNATANLYPNSVSYQPTPYYFQYPSAYQYQPSYQYQSRYRASTSGGFCIGGQCYR
jgi:hypothetical protein